MRILQISKYYPPEFGGIETVARDLSTGFAERGHQSDVLAFTRFDAKTETIDGVAVERVRATVTPMSQALSLRWFVRAVGLARKADVIVIQWPNLLPMLLVPFWRRQTVVIFWQSDLIGKGIASHIVRPLQWLMLRCADLIWTSTPRYAKASPALQPVRDKVRAMPIGITDPTLAGIPAAIPANIAAFVADRKLVIAIGRLVSYKGFDQLIRAFARVNCDAALVIVGTGPQEEVLRGLIAEFGIEDRVMLAGRASEDALRALLGNAALYVMSSNQRSEAFGVVQVEAMAFGLPIVATRVPDSGVDWVSGDGATGAAVPINDPPAMAEAIDRLLTDQAGLPALRARSRARYESEFTRDKMVSRALELIAEFSVKPGKDVAGANRTA